MTGTNKNLEVQDNHSFGIINVNVQTLPFRVFIFCLVAEILLVFLDASVNYAHWSDFSTIRRLFNITREDGLATWFMVIQTFVVALVLWVIVFLQRNRRVSGKRIVGWGFLAVFFTYLSADDGAMIHERMGTLTEKIFEAERYGYSNSFLAQVQEIFPSYEWQLVVLPLFAAAGLFMLFFLWIEFNKKQERVILFVAAFLMAFAVGLDFIEGLDFSHSLNLAAWISNTFDLTKYTVEHFSKSLEEFLEMLAMSLLLALFLRHLIRISGTGLTFRFLGVRHSSE